MRWWRPKSLSGLMLVGLALIAVPLLIAILTAVLQIRDLADRGQKIVIQGVAGARASQQLFSQMASLERTALVERVAQQSNAQVDSEVAALEAQTLHARNRLLWQTAPLLPLALVAVFVLTLGVGRPLRQLDRAISELGQGAFTNPIAVAGPHDLERLGGQLEWLRQRLLELAHERNRFLRHISHELKTPLANIREG